MGITIVSPVLPLYAESFQVSYALVGLVVSAYAFTRTLLDIPVGTISQTHDKRRLMMGGLVLLTISSIIAGFAPSFWILILARIFAGVGT